MEKNRLFMKRLSSILLILAIGFTLPACQGRPSKGKNSVIIALEQSPGNLDPRLGTDVSSARVHELIFDPLVTTDQKAEIVPHLAWKWESVEGKVYTFFLRPGVEFHSGKKLTADDVKYTFESLLDEKFFSPKKEHFRIIKAIDAVDDHTVRFTLREPFSSFLINEAGIGIIPQGSGEECHLRPIGSGLFKFLYYKDDEEVGFAAFDNYWGGSPKVDRIIYKIIPDSTTRVLELRKGSIDLVINAIPEEIIQSIEREPHLKVLKKQGCIYSYIGLNMRDPILANHKVRWAIGYAIDREGIIRNLLHNLATPASGILAPSNWAYEGEVTTFSYNPARAKELLDEAGYPDPDGDGPQGRFHLVFKTPTLKWARDISTVINENLKQVGIDLEIRSYEWQTFYNDIIKGNFQLYPLRWIGATDPDIYRYCFHSQSLPPKGANRGGYHNQTIDRLIDQARTTTNREELKELYSQIQKIIANDAPYISLWYNTNVAVMKKEIQGLTLYPTATFRVLKNLYIK